ncbi:2-phospho-L-lactate guanylyltransferase [Saccharopolyspora sp. HNM0986]|uniref:2-phospho-L-lactate guanylyltransferase n=1 Tax=Saccharopolyspora galaxeae TaxID=2781241 RepID=UPI001909C317|nr:2-phospho-L-lactate guanylyltransferase [Saccharopolyspora sp. HNM0986]MBK0867543.1 2-phospho-L-lactate guanylyltransferase [Saccharopolyspora sp. HNM0986]
MSVPASLLVPIKPLRLAKTRLRGDRPADAHAALVSAVAHDTVEAARRAAGVREVLVVTSDPELTDSFAAAGVEVVADDPDAGLNPALEHGERVLRDRGADRIGALQADLPALRPEDLARALHAAGPERAFTPDRQRTGTTLLLAAAGAALAPRFGNGSALAHEASGARRLAGRWESLRCDVDTAADLRRAARIGLGPRTAAWLARASQEHADPGGVPGDSARTDGA